MKHKEITRIEIDPSKIEGCIPVKMVGMIDKRPKEEWKEVSSFPGYENAKGYMVSNYGRMCCTNHQPLSFMRLRIHDEYLAVFMVGKGGITFIHRLVAMGWLKNPENKKYVNHIDGNKRNCVVWNLEWTTPAENNYHAAITGLKPVRIVTLKAAYEIKKILATQKYTIGQIAKEFGISTTSVIGINIGYCFRYVSPDEFTYPIMFTKVGRKIPENKRVEVMQMVRAEIPVKDIARKTGIPTMYVFLIKSGIAVQTTSRVDYTCDTNDGLTAHLKMGS